MGRLMAGKLLSFSAFPPWLDRLPSLEMGRGRFHRAPALSAGSGEAVAAESWYRNGLDSDNARNMTRLCHHCFPAHDWGGSRKSNNFHRSPLMWLIEEHQVASCTLASNCKGTQDVQ